MEKRVLDLYSNGSLTTLYTKVYLAHPPANWLSTSLFTYGDNIAIDPIFGFF